MLERPRWSLNEHHVPLLASLLPLFIRVHVGVLLSTPPSDTSRPKKDSGYLASVSRVKEKTRPPTLRSSLLSRAVRAAWATLSCTCRFFSRAFSSRARRRAWRAASSPRSSSCSPPRRPPVGFRKGGGGGELLGEPLLEARHHLVAQMLLGLELGETHAEERKCRPLGTGGKKLSMQKNHFSSLQG